MNYKFHGNVTDGKLALQNRTGFKDVLTCFDGEITLTIEKRKKERSGQQNKYYWGAVVPIVRQALTDVGYQRVSISEVHNLLKTMFIKKEMVNDCTGEVLTFIGSTAELSTVDFMAFIENVAAWLAEFLGVVLPEPGQQIEIE